MYRRIQLIVLKEKKTLQEIHTVYMCCFPQQRREAVKRVACLSASKLDHKFSGWWKHLSIHPEVKDLANYVLIFRVHLPLLKFHSREVGGREGRSMYPRTWQRLVVYWGFRSNAELILDTVSYYQFHFPSFKELQTKRTAWCLFSF